jgi:hypothetical protein
MFSDMFSIQVILDNKAHDVDIKSSAFVCLPVGSVSGDNGVRKLFKKFGALKRRTQNDYSHGRHMRQVKVNKHNPSMIEALLCRAMECKCEDCECESVSNCQCVSKCQCTDTVIKGGLLDIDFRKTTITDTCFALVRSVYDWSLQHSIESKIQPFLTVMAHFHIFVIKKLNYKHTKMVSSDGFLTQRNGLSNYLFSIIRRAAFDASQLSDYDYDVSLCSNVFHDAMAGINANIKNWDQTELKKNALIEAHDTSIQLSNLMRPVVSIPDPIDFTGTKERTSGSDDFPFRKPRTFEAEIIDLRLETLTPLKLPTSLSSALDWSKSYVKSSDIYVIFFLRNIECFFWMMSESHLGEDSLNASDISHVMELVDNYRSVVHDFLARIEQASQDKVTFLRSLEILVVWLSYCLVFNSISKGYPKVMNGFGVALKHTDLQHLVLQDKKHRDVFERVVLFLHQNAVPNCDIFSIRTDLSWNSATYEMGEKYSEINLLSIYETTKKDSKTRENQHWEEVKRKKNLAKDLRTDRDRLETSFQESQLKERNAHSAYNNSKSEVSGPLYDKYQACKTSSHSLKLAIGRKNKEIKKTLESPDPVIQPLPKDRKKAMKVLFFLYMPPCYRILARLTFNSQQLLLPSPWISNVGGEDGTSSFDIFELVKESTQLQNTWLTHYNNHQSLYNTTNTEQPEGRSCEVLLNMESDCALPPKIGSRSVDDLKSPSDGVWYPDGRGIRMSWTGGKNQWDKHPTGSQFNPYLIKSELTGT